MQCGILRRPACAAIQGPDRRLEAFSFRGDEPANRPQRFVACRAAERRYRKEGIEGIEEAEVAGAVQRRQACGTALLLDGAEVLLDLLRDWTDQQLRRFGTDHVLQPGTDDLGVPGLAHSAGEPLELGPLRNLADVVSVSVRKVASADRNRRAATRS